MLGDNLYKSARFLSLMTIKLIFNCTFKKKYKIFFGKRSNRLHRRWIETKPRKWWKNWKAEFTTATFQANYFTITQSCQTQLLTHICPSFSNLYKFFIVFSNPHIVFRIWEGRPDGIFISAGITQLFRDHLETNLNWKIGPFWTLKNILVYLSCKKWRQGPKHGFRVNKK
jgi:hypothetical protein